jgi:hypothetical protein
MHIPFYIRIAMSQKKTQVPKYKPSEKDEIFKKADEIPGLNPNYYRQVNKKSCLFAYSVAG